MEHPFVHPEATALFYVVNLNDSLHDDPASHSFFDICFRCICC